MRLQPLQAVVKAFKVAIFLLTSFQYVRQGQRCAEAPALLSLLIISKLAG